MQFLSIAYAFVCAHGPATVLFLLAVLPTLITGLSKYPTAGGFVDFLKLVLNILSVVSHRDSPGTFKAPLTISKAPEDGRDNVIELQPPRGFSRLAVLIALAVLSVAAAAHAQANPNALPDAIGKDPAAVQPEPPAPAPSSFGGCVGKFCFAPAVTISLAAVNLTTKKIEGAFSPGIGYGFTYLPGRWYSLGADAYFVVDPGAQQASVSVLASFFNGYFRPGVSKGFIGDQSWRLLIGVGLAL